MSVELKAWTGALQAEDWPRGIVYHHGTMSCPDAQLWGGHS